MTGGGRGHYVALGVPTTATQREIKAAFRRLARETHPDRQAGREPSVRSGVSSEPGAPAAGRASAPLADEGPPELERRFKRIARAYAVLGDPVRRRAYDKRQARGRFAAPGTAGPATYVVDTGPLYHSDLGHHSDFYQAGDPLTVTEAATLIKRDPGWLRRAIRAGRLRATRSPAGYLLRRRDAERLDRTARRRRGGALSDTGPRVESDTTEA